MMFKFPVILLHRHDEIMTSVLTTISIFIRKLSVFLYLIYINYFLLRLFKYISSEKIIDFTGLRLPFLSVRRYLPHSSDIVLLLLFTILRFGIKCISRILPLTSYALILKLINMSTIKVTRSQHHIERSFKKYKPSIKRM